jgi:hypothetical protein
LFLSEFRRPKTLDEPHTATAGPPDEDSPEAVRRQANLALDRIAQRLGLSPQKLRQLILEKRTDEILALANSGLPLPPDDTCDNAAFTGPEPWPEPVHASMLLRRICNAIAFHVHMDGYLALVAALWAMHTHALAEFTRTPRLVIHSGHVASGKTTLLSVLSCLVHRPLKICAAKPNSLIAAIGDRPTLLIDDAAALLRGNPDAHAVIRNGCCRSGARLLRMRRGSLATHHPEAVDLFTPIAVALDGDIPPLFAGRAIGIPLEPLPPGQTAGALSPEAIDNLSEMGRMIARWARDEDDAVAKAAASAEGEDPNWLPLVAIAIATGDEWNMRAGEAMRRVRGASATSELERLLSDIRSVMHDIRAGRRPLTGPDGKQIGDYDRIRSIDLIEQLCAVESGRWSQHGRSGQPITPHALARILAGANIRPGMLRFHTGDENGQGVTFNDRGYLFTQFTQAFERHLPFHAREAV